MNDFLRKEKMKRFLKTIRSTVLSNSTFNISPHRWFVCFAITYCRKELKSQCIVYVGLLDSEEFLFRIEETFAGKCCINLWRI